MARYSAQWNGGPHFEPVGYLTDYYTDEAIKVIEANRNRPFFLYLAHWGIHTPLQALKSDYDAVAHIEDDALRVYAGMILSMDRSVRRIQEALEAHGLAENTLVVFTSDHGGANYIGLPNVNEPYRGWKLTHFEGGLHVPFAARWPARIAPGTVMDDPVHHFDLFTTFAAAAGARLPGDRVIDDGVDLLPYIRGEAHSVPHETLFWRQGHQQTVLHQDWKLIRADRPDKVWLFDLANDPTEQHNVAEAHPKRVAQLQALLRPTMRGRSSPCGQACSTGPSLWTTRSTNRTSRATSTSTGRTDEPCESYRAGPRHAPASSQTALPNGDTRDFRPTGPGSRRTLLGVDVAQDAALTPHSWCVATDANLLAWPHPVTNWWTISTLAAITWHRAACVEPGFAGTTATLGKTTPTARTGSSIA